MRLPPLNGRLGALAIAFLFAAFSADAASVVVSNTNDDGPGSLRAAVAAAAPADTIEFNIPATDPGYDASTGVFTIKLTSGEIVIDKHLTITGPHLANVAVSGNHASRILHVRASKVDISYLAFINGRAKGADGAQDGSGQPGAPGVGGAVLNDGALTVTHCTFEGSTAVGGNAGWWSSWYVPGGPGGDALGGAIANQNSLALIACTFASNSATAGKGASGGYRGFSNSTTGIAAGGAVYNASTGTLLVENCTLTANTAVTPEMYISAVGTPPRAAHGGGIANFGAFTVVHSTVASNTAAGGSQYYENYSRRSLGGGLYVAQGSTTAMRDTIVAMNLIVTGSGGIASGAAAGPDVNGAVTSEGHNLLGRSDGATGFTSDDQQGGTTDKTRLDPRLGPLGNYGGPTKTLPLLPRSSAIDTGSSVPPDTDQRGFARQRQPDIGAFEYQGPQPSVLANISTRARVQEGDKAIIGGFIITGTQLNTLVVRAVGPSLTVPGALLDPVMEIYDSSGTLIATNDNWSEAETRTEIVASGLAPEHPSEPALWGVINPGAYTVAIRGKGNAAGVALVEVYDLDRGVNSKLGNISTRAFVETDDNVMIGGFIVLGEAGQKAIVRAIGPSLPVTGALADPALELYDGNGTLIAANDNWRSDQGSRDRGDDDPAVT